MSKYGIINLIDKIFISVAVFLLVYAWINFFVMDLVATFFLSLIFASAIVFLIFYIFNKKENKKNMNKKLISEINKSFLNFKLLEKNKKIALIKKILEKNYQITRKNENFLYIFEGVRHVVTICTTHTKITKNDFFNIIAAVPFSFDELEIICEDCENFNLNIIKGKKIIIVDKQKLYAEYFLKNNIFPDEILNEESIKPGFKEIVKNFFTPNKAKGYFICGLILIFSSIILPYHIYYIVFGSVLMLFAITCKLIKIKN